MIVVPNYNLHDIDSDMTVYIPFADTGLDYYRNYTVTDAETGELIVSGSASKVAQFTVNVPYEDQRVFMVKASGRIDLSEYNDEDTDSTASQTPEKEPETDNSESSGTTEETVVVKRRKKKNSNDSSFPVIPVAVGSAAVVLAAGGVTAVLLIRKRNKAKQPPVK